jgi:hypothetical protein
MEDSYQPSTSRRLQATQHRRQPDWDTVRIVAVVDIVKQERSRRPNKRRDGAEWRQDIEALVGLGRFNRRGGNKRRLNAM